MANRTEGNQVNLAVEYVSANSIKAYLESVMDAAVLAACPVASWFDLMETGDDDRIVVFCPSANNRPEDPSSFMVEAQVMVKTQFAQATLAADIAKHFSRVNDIRNALLNPNLATALAALTDGDQLVIDDVNKAMQFATDTGEVFIASEAALQIKCHLPPQGN